MNIGYSEKEQERRANQNTSPKEITRFVCLNTWFFSLNSWNKRSKAAEEEKSGSFFFWNKNFFLLVLVLLLLEVFFCSEKKRTILFSFWRFLLLFLMLNKEQVLFCCSEKVFLWILETSSRTAEHPNSRTSFLNRRTPLLFSSKTENHWNDIIWIYS